MIPLKKLPLHIGVPILIAVLLAAGVLEFGPYRSVALGAAILLALWMAYSLDIRPHEDELPDMDPDTPEIGDPDPDAPEPLRPLTEEEQKELEHEAERHRPLRRP